MAKKVSDAEDYAHDVIMDTVCEFGRDADRKSHAVAEAILNAFRKNGIVVTLPNPPIMVVADGWAESAFC